jgi:NADH dehydrogenase
VGRACGRAGNFAVVSNRQNGTGVAARPKVVILGAGFAGLAAARALAAAPVRTTIVDRNYYNTFQPLLYEVATGGLNPGDVAYPIRNLLPSRENLDFRWGTVDRIDLDTRRVHLEDGAVLDYDFLIIATGATTNYFGVPGAGEHAMAIYTLDDALAVRRQMFEQLEHAASADGDGHQGSQLNVVVVGGGPTGVEMAGALAELRAVLLAKAYRGLDPGMAAVVLVEQNDRLLNGFEDRLRVYAAHELTRRGVDVRVATAVLEVTPEGVTLSSRDGSKTFLPAGLVVWAAGVGAGGLASRSAIATTRSGRIKVGANLAVTGHPEVFAVGDVGAMPANTSGAGIADGKEAPILPQLAQPAIQGGEHAAAEIAAAVTGTEVAPFSYKDKGIMATIGRRSAVAEVTLPIGHGHIPLRGTLAWLAWLGLHISFLLGGRNRAAVLLNWAWRYVAWRRGPRVIVGG